MLTIKILTPGLSWDPLLRAAILAELDRRAEALRALEELLALIPDFEERARFYIEFYIWSEELVNRFAGKSGESAGTVCLIETNILFPS